METASEPAIAIRDLTYSVGGVRVLDGISVDVARGETFGVMGMSGSGKSTFLRAIIGLIQPESGDVRIGGQSIIGLSEREMDAVRLGVGMCFQYSALFDSMNVRDNVLFGLRRHRHIPPDEMAARCASMLERVGMAGTEERMPSELSGGMRKRVGIARALIMDPSIVLYDEPSAGLDPVMSGIIDDLICKLGAEFGTTSIIVTHEVGELFELSNRVMMLYQGKTIICDTPEAVRASDDPVVRQFVTGSPTGPIQT
jgi:phospholipid/cholesterol/gamma-HCH transport system ATP-binding protein